MADGLTEGRSARRSSVRTRDGARAGILLVACLLPALSVPAQQEEPPKPVTRVVEVVRGEDGKPFPGATVEAFGLPGGVVAKTAGKEGVARFEGVPRTGVVFVARSPGFVCAFHEPGGWSWFRNEEDEDVDGDGVTRVRLTLMAGSRFEGRVLTPEGEPIPGAVVEARQKAHATDMTLLDGAPFWSAVSDVDGRFRVNEHWTGAWFDEHKVVSMDVSVRAKGKAHEVAETWPSEDGKFEPLEFRLRAAGTIRGSITGPDGKPAVHACVHAGPLGRPMETGTPELEVFSGPDGRFVMEEVLPGVRYQVHAEGREVDPRSDLGSLHAVSRSRLSPETGIEKPGQEAVCDLRLRRLGEVRVREAPEGGGAAKVWRVELLPPPGVGPWVDDREEDGATIFEGVDPGPWTLKVDAPGWLAYEATVEVAEGETKEIPVRLDRGASLEGVLVDDEGKPVPGAALYAYARDPEDPDGVLSELGYEEARTDLEGRFRFQGLRPGPTSLGLGGGEDRYRQDGYARSVAPATGVKVAVFRRAGLRLRVSVPAGAAAPAKAGIFVTRIGGESQGGQQYFEEELRDGACLLADMIPGSCTVAVDVPGFAPCVRRVEVKAGGISEPEPFVLEDGLPLPGRVVDGAGKPLPGARIRPWGNEERGATSGADGTFAVLHLGPGPVTLSVIAPGCAEAILDVKASPGAAPLEIAMRPGGLVHGKVRDRKGGIPEYACLEFFPGSAKDRGGSRWRTEAKEDGTYSLRLPAGRYRFVPAFGRFDRDPVFLDVPEGGEVPLDLLSD